MADLFLTGQIVDLIIVLMVAEGLVLGLLHRRTGKGVSLADLAPNMLAGLFLLLALRAALTGAPWTWVALSLIAALIAHLADVARRWKKA